MKKIKTYLILFLILILTNNCTKDFVKPRLPLPPKTDYPVIENSEIVPLSLCGYQPVNKPAGFQVKAYQNMEENCVAGVFVPHETFMKIHKLISLKTNRIITLTEIIKKTHE